MQKWKRLQFLSKRKLRQIIICIQSFGKYLKLKKFMLKWEVRMLSHEHLTENICRDWVRYNTIIFIKNAEVILNE